MEPQNISFMNPVNDACFSPANVSQKNSVSFQSFLDDSSLSVYTDDPVGTTPECVLGPPPVPTTENPLKIIRGQDAVAAYKKQQNQNTESCKLSDLAKYKDDQLLSNPGGDHYYLNEKKVVSNPGDQESFWGRIGKDISDAFGNVKNFFANLLFGAKICYRDKDNQIRDAQQRGLVGSVVDFFKDLGSAFSFGMWRPDGEEEPRGLLKRVGFFFSKIKEAVFGDLIQGVSGSIAHMSEDLLFAGWNLVETVPDATIGNFEQGRKATTSFFDNGQVVLDYLTDILPSGDAWVRVHSPNLEELELPVLNNLNMPEYNAEDARWKYVRNTPLRKTIETIGSILADILTLKILGQVRFLGEERHHRN